VPRPPPRGWGPERRHAEAIVGRAPAPRSPAAMRPCPTPRQFSS
jgi:hypothetical protein